MIGVAVRPGELEVAAEFFELFKTPWEPFVPGRSYKVVLSADDQTVPRDAALGVVYSAVEHPIDRRAGAVATTSTTSAAAWEQDTIPLYKGALAFPNEGRPSSLRGEGGAMDYGASFDGMPIRRVGYDLFGEIAHLLTVGQPQAHAQVPALELHIAYLRRCLADAGVEYLEVPPRPNHAEFICCLTHDLDFFGIRRQRVGRTLVGFALRGTVGTFVDTVRGRRPVDEAIRNVLAVLSLPLVFVGLRQDLWQPFRDYAEADRGHRSTFFVVPFKGQPGTTPDGGIEPRRAVSYGVRDIEHELEDVLGAGNELAVHGIDAWRSASAARAERQELLAVTRQDNAGVRMHWLYFADHSPRTIEDAGFAYDSTCGYNDAVGFRAGTLQAFRPRGTRQLLELPLTIMDSAMFYPDRMGLSREDAASCCARIVQHARRFGGALVVNWHDRSLAPERQWGRCYAELLDRIEASNGWFATAAQAVAWFRWRRAIRFSGDTLSRQVTVTAPEVPEGLPPARLALRGRRVVDETSFAGGSCDLTL